MESINNTIGTNARLAAPILIQILMPDFILIATISARAKYKSSRKLSAAQPELFRPLDKVQQVPFAILKEQHLAATGCWPGSLGKFHAAFFKF